MTAKLKVRTPAQVRADARMLAGTPSRVAMAAAGDGESPEQPAGSVGELWLYGVVGGWWRGFDAESVSAQLRKLDVDQLFVRVHSPGGYAADGVAIANLLRNHRATVTVVVDGLAASAASVIALAGDTVVMCPGSQMMLHDASTYAYGNAAEIRRTADWVDGQSENYAGVYAYRAGGTAAQWREVMQANDGDGTWYTADGAVAAGLADEVGTRVAVGSPPVEPAEDDLDDDDIYAQVAHDLALLEQAVHPDARAAWAGEKPRPRSTPKPPNASAGGSPNTEGGSAVAFSDEQLNTLRSQLGLPEDADEGAILAAVTTVVEENDELGTETGGQPTARTAVPEGMSLVDTETLAALRAGAEDGRAAREEQRNADRDRTIDAAMQAGKFPKSRREHYAKAWNADPDGTRELLASMESGLVPVAELGHGDEPAEDGGAYASIYGTTEQKGA